VLDDINGDHLKDLIVAAVRTAKRASGIDFDENIVIKENVNGYEGRVYFRLLRRTGAPFRIKLDLTKSKAEKIVFPPEKKKIIHPYSDDCMSCIWVYPLEEMMAEKLRALFERTRPRDLYDVWYMRNEPDHKTVFKIFLEKCKFKKVEPDIQSLIERRDDFYNAWENSLKHQLKHVPDFNKIFEGVIRMIKGLLMKR